MYDFNRVNYKMIKNKKGDAPTVLGEIEKIIIAVVCIFVLLYLAWSLYGLFTEKTRFEQAKASFNGIDAILNNMIPGQTKSYLFLSPNDWYIYSLEGNNFLQGTQGEFSLCICGNKKCDGSTNTYYCKHEKRVIVFEDSNGKRMFSWNTNAPANLNFSLELINISVMTPYVLSVDTISDRTPVFVFFRFNNGWEASADLKDWKGVGAVASDLRSQGTGLDWFVNNKVPDAFLNMLDNFKTISGESEGEALIKKSGGVKSEGFVIVRISNAK